MHETVFQSGHDKIDTLGYGLTRLDQLVDDVVIIDSAFTYSYYMFPEMIKKLDENP